MEGGMESGILILERDYTPGYGNRVRLRYVSGAQLARAMQASRLAHLCAHLRLLGWLGNRHFYCWSWRLRWRRERGKNRSASLSYLGHDLNWRVRLFTLYNVLPAVLPQARRSRPARIFPSTKVATRPS